MNIAWTDGALDALSLLAVALDSDAHVVYVNSQLAGLLGVSVAELLGTPWASLTGASAAEPLVDLAAGVGLDRPLPDSALGTLRVPQDGARNVRWTLAVARGLAGREGPVLLCLGSDLTSARRSDEAARELESRLRYAQKMEALGRLSGGIAHDVNNVLTVITSASALIAEPSCDARSRVELAEEILHASARGAELTRQLLVFSRRQHSKVRPMDLNRLLTTVLRMLRRVLGASFEIVEALDPLLPPVICDPGQIEQVVVNLVLNARDAMPYGGRLTVHTARGGRHVPAGPSVALTLRDTGTGMPAAVKARAFEAYYTTKPVGTGTGLGLATCLSIVEQLGGRISLESEPGRGTEVLVELPVASSHAEASQSSGVGVGLEARGETVLFVEDEPLVRRSVARVLRNLGYTVLVADNASHAEVLADGADPIDLLITDVVMPGRSGHELACALRERLPGIGVVYLSGQSDDEGVQLALADGQAVRFVQKPFHPRVLAAALRSLLDVGRRLTDDSQTVP